MYEYVCESCGHYFSERKKIDDRKDPEFLPCPECGEIRIQLTMTGAPAFGDPIRLGIRRPDDGFKEVLKNIHKNNDSTVQSRYI